jgi:hypothetical protein
MIVGESYVKAIALIRLLGGLKETIYRVDSDKMELWRAPITWMTDQ